MMTSSKHATHYVIVLFVLEVLLRITEMFGHVKTAEIGSSVL